VVQYLHTADNKRVYLSGTVSAYSGQQESISQWYNICIQRTTREYILVVQYLHTAENKRVYLSGTVSAYSGQQESISQWYNICIQRKTREYISVVQYLHTAENKRVYLSGTVSAYSKTSCCHLPQNVGIWGSTGMAPRILELASRWW